METGRGAVKLVSGGSGKGRYSLRSPLRRRRRGERRPFLVNMSGGVLIPLMRRAATGTGPQPITQGDGMIDEATDMATFGGREKAVDVMDMRPVLLGSLMQNLHKPAKARIHHFAAPQRWHAVQL